MRPGVGRQGNPQSRYPYRQASGGCTAEPCRGRASVVGPLTAIALGRLSQETSNVVTPACEEQNSRRSRRGSSLHHNPALPIPPNQLWPGRFGCERQ